MLKINTLSLTYLGITTVLILLCTQNYNTNLILYQEVIFTLSRTIFKNFWPYLFHKWNIKIRCTFYFNTSSYV
jgi:hypothetical protein